MSEKKDGLLRIPLCMDSKNPKDPPQALLDTGANCNLISSDYASHNFDQDIIENSMPTRRIKFANKSRSETCKQLNMNFDIDQHGVIKCFNAEFLVCPDLCENVILGRPFLDSSGLTHLCITSSTVSQLAVCLVGHFWTVFSLVIRGSLAGAQLATFIFPVIKRESTVLQLG